MSEAVDIGFLTGQRIQSVILAALAAMPEDIKAERVAYCNRTDQHGVRVYPSGAGLDLQWAGQRLAFIDVDALTEDALLGLEGSLEGHAVEDGDE